MSSAVDETWKWEGAGRTPRFPSPAQAFVNCLRPDDPAASPADLRRAAMARIVDFDPTRRA